MHITCQIFIVIGLWARKVQWVNKWISMNLRCLCMYVYCVVETLRGIWQGFGKQGEKEMKAQSGKPLQAEVVGPLIKRALEESNILPKAFCSQMHWTIKRYDAVVKRKIGPIYPDECALAAGIFNLTHDEFLDGTEAQKPPTRRRTNSVRECVRANIILLVRERPNLCGAHIGPIVGRSRGFFTSLKKDKVLITTSLIKELEEKLALPQGWLTNKRPDRSIFEGLASPD